MVLSRSGFTGQQVIRSTNGGGSWTDVTANLPNIPANGIVITLDGNQVGMIAGGILILLGAVAANGVARRGLWATDDVRVAARQSRRSA